MYTIAYYTDNTFLFTEEVKATDPFTALDVAHERQPILAGFCNSQDPKHPSRHIGPRGIEVRVRRVDEVEPDNN